MSNPYKILLITFGVVILGLIALSIFDKPIEKQPETQPLEYSVINEGEYGIAAELGYKLTLLIDHKQWTKADILNTAIKEIQAAPNSYKYKEFTVFVNDTSSKYLNMSLYKMETTEKLYKLKPESFTFEELPSQEPKFLKPEREY